MLTTLRIFLAYFCLFILKSVQPLTYLWFGIIPAPVNICVMYRSIWTKLNPVIYKRVMCVTSLHPSCNMFSMLATFLFDWHHFRTVFCFMVFVNWNVFENIVRLGSTNTYFTVIMWIEVSFWIPALRAFTFRLLWTNIRPGYKASDAEPLKAISTPLHNNFHLFSKP